MNPKLLPIRYHLEIYEESFVNDPTISFEGDSPFMAFAKGDYVDASSWPTEYRNWFKIADIAHHIWQIDGSHIGQQTRICIVRSERPE